ncbi:MAG: hypothetical protein K0R29_471 [Pseudobdellovibrio sp.]|nr:hypothetical protein [Pseudobdellovibrio sp.]
MTGNYLLIATLLLQAAVAMALQPSISGNSVSGTTLIGTTPPPEATLPRPQSGAPINETTTTTGVPPTGGTAINETRTTTGAATNGTSINETTTTTGVPTTGGTRANDAATIPPVAPPGRGLSNENDNIIVIDTFDQPGISTLPVESTTDAVLATRIQNELIRAIPSYTASGRQINSQSGHVTIQGSVRTQAESREIMDVIKRMPGVKSVRNNLTVEETGGVR